MIIVVLFSFLFLFSLHAHGQEDNNVIDFDRLLTQIVIERFEKTLGKGIIQNQVSPYKHQLLVLGLSSGGSLKIR